jgi:hypothetical protein
MRLYTALLFIIPAIAQITLPAQTQTDWITQVKNKPAYDAREYQFTRTNGLNVSGVLSSSGAGKVLTFTSAPKGIAYSASYPTYVYISGGTGTAEAALITATTCLPAGGTACTVTVTTANTHSGAWTTQSASGGIKEASIATGGKGVINLPSGDLNIRAPLILPTTQTLFGHGGATTALAGTNTTLVCAAAASPCLVIADGAGTATNQGVGIHRGYSLLGPGSGYGLWIGGDPSSVFAPTAWTGSYVRFENINVTGFAEAAYHRKGNFVDYSGVVLTGTTSAFHIPSDCAGEMQPINIYNSLISTPPGGPASIDMDCSGTMSGPVTVFGGQISGTITGDAVDLEFFGSHFESNENGIPLLNITNNAQHLVRIHGGILAFHGAAATTLASGIIMSGAGLYSLSIEGAWIQADTGYTVTNMVEFDPTLGGDLVIRNNVFALAGTFTNLFSSTLTTMQTARISVEQPVAPSAATGVTAGATVTFPHGNYPVTQPMRVFGATVGGGITAVAGLRAYSSGTLSTNDAQTFTAGATIGNTITTTANLPYQFYFDGTKIWIN